MTIRLGDIASIRTGKQCKEQNSGVYPVYGAGGIIGHTDTPLARENTVIIPCRGTIKRRFFSASRCWPTATTFYLTLEDESILKTEYLFRVLDAMDFEAMNASPGGIPGIRKTQVENLKIEVPPLSVQDRAIEEMRTLDEGIRNITNMIELVDRSRVDYSSLIFSLLNSRRHA